MGRRLLPGSFPFCASSSPGSGPVCRCSMLCRSVSWSFSCCAPVVVILRASGWLAPAGIDVLILGGPGRAVLRDGEDDLFDCASRGMCRQYILVSRQYGRQKGLG